MDFTVDPRAVYSPSTGQTTESKTHKLNKLRETSQEFEAMYINEMYKAMRKTVPESELIEKNSAEKMYQEMQDMEMARSISQGQGVGIADAIYNQMAPLIEQQKP